MHAITHLVGIKATAEMIYELLTTDNGLSCWWTEDVSGAGEVGAIIEFRFSDGGPDFTVSELITNKRVRWTFSAGEPEEWTGTEVLFDLNEQDDQTFVHFSHLNWASSSNLMAHCNTKWAVFMLSLKDAAETGQGQPFPNDILIDHS